MTTRAAFVLLGLAASVHAEAVSPVQKVVELLEQCKAKIVKDLAAEQKEMDEYAAFCDDETKDKAYAISTAERTIEDLNANKEDAAATIAELEDEIALLGTEIASKDKELYEATTARSAENKVFVEAEKTMLESVAELQRAVEVLKQGQASAFLQGARGSARRAKMEKVVQVLSTIVEAQGLDQKKQAALSVFLQKAKRDKDGDDDDDDDLLLAQMHGGAGQAPKPKAIESSSGGIIETVEEMLDKAETQLSDLRKKETQAQNSFQLIQQGLNSEIEHGQDKLASATSGKAAATESLEQANGNLVETKKTEAADEEYLATLQTECQTTAKAWEERQKSAKDEMGAIEKAKEILVSGVKAFVQVSQKTSRASMRRAESGDDDDEDDVKTSARKELSTFLKNLARKHHSFALSLLASRAASDPFVKIRGLIEDMIAKLLKEAEEEATHEAFCQEEMGKSKKSQEEKTAKVEKYKNRIDAAESTSAQLTDAIKTLEAEVAEIDKAQAEATKIRTEEKTEYDRASKDFRDSAEAVARAIEVLKAYYEGALLQVSQKTSRAKAPSFGGAKSDTGSTIISVLEMAEEDFTTLLAETESSEDEAVKAYDKLSQENKVSKSSKLAEAKAKASEVQSLKVGLENAKEDHASTSEELDSVLAYIEKLKPECESKAMSYAEKKAAREAEIEGLKNALEILEGKGLSLAQLGHHHRAARLL
jgi:hypothetical protein